MTIKVTFEVESVEELAGFAAALVAFKKGAPVERPALKVVTAAVAPAEKAAVAPAEKAAVAGIAAHVEKVADEPKPPVTDAITVTRDMLSAAAVKLGTKSRTIAVSTLAKYGATRAKEVKDEDVAQCYGEMTTILESLQ